MNEHFRSGKRVEQMLGAHHSMQRHSLPEIPPNLRDRYQENVQSRDWNPWHRNAVMIQRAMSVLRY